LAGASSAYSTTSDMARYMARYMAALPGGGAGSRGLLLQPETLATMFEPHSALLLAPDQRQR
jgi:hypothetical protein